MTDYKLAGIKDPDLAAIRDGFGTGLLELGKENGAVVALCGDLTESTRVHHFAKACPERFFQMGITEQTMMGAAAGFALTGKIAFISSYAAFNPGRNWDFLRTSVCYNNVNVKVIGGHAGLTVGPDGATHQALEDLALTRVLPNMTVVVPCDTLQAHKATLAIGEIKTPCYLRVGRDKTPVVTSEDTPFELGKGQLYLDGKDVLIVACGVMVYEALLAAHKLKKKKVSCAVVNMHTIKPLDVDLLVKLAKKCKRVVTCEEHQVAGGLGSAVAECLSMHYPVPIEMVGVHDTFGESGNPKDLMKKYGLTANHIVIAVDKVLKRK